MSVSDVNRPVSGNHDCESPCIDRWIDASTAVSNALTTVTPAAEQGCNQPRRLWHYGSPLLAGSLAIATSWAIAPATAQAQTTRLPSTPGLVFQTNGPASCAGIGDWYTTAGIAGGANCPTAPADPLVNYPVGTVIGPGTDTTNPAANRLHRFFISVTPQDLVDAGGAVIVRVLDAESNGDGLPAATSQDRDQVNGISVLNPNFSLACNAANNNNCDPTRFTLRNLITSTVIDTVTVPGGTPNGFTITFPTITSPGTYEVTSETGALFITGDTNPRLNDDQNSFSIEVTGVSDLLIGQFQGSVEFFNPANPVVDTNINLNLYFLVGPGTGSLFLRNFDMDGPPAGAAGQSIQYVSPPGGIGTQAGTVSGDANWNGGGNLNTGGDTVAGLNPINDAGTWQFQVLNFRTRNQAIFEANTADTPASRLPLFDSEPQRAGNFVITPNTTLTTTIGTPVDHPFTVTNNFFTTDIVNLALTGTDPNYTVQLINPATGLPLTDTDGDGVPDTGILQVGQTINLILRVTPNAGAVGADTTVISATSFMDREVRQQANNGLPVPQTVTKITSIPGIIGDTVFIDTNGNGVQDPGETGAAGVTLTLTGTDVNGNPVNLTVTTDANGNYQFPNVLPGTYTVTITLPPGFAATTGTTQTVTLAAGQSITTVDFGIRQLAAIGDTVFLDANGNGVQDGGEVGIGSVTLTLTGTDTGGNPVNRTTTTSASGNYLFTDLPPGTYTIIATPPTGFNATTPNPQTVTIAAGQTITTVDFGFRQAPGVIGDTVFNDINGDGVQGLGEPGLGGVLVTLTGTDVNGNPVNRTVTTDANGNYQFANVLPGNYTVTITPPGGFTGTTPITLPVTLQPGQVINTIDFGLRQIPGNIGDTVFNDVNGNGVQDPGDVGVGGVTVTLTGTDANGNPVTLTTTTDANGNYQFTNVPPGSYSITITPPPGQIVTNPNPQIVNLQPGQTINNIDFGVTVTTGIIGDRVFNDFNGDGVQTGSEPGIAGVTVNLLDAGNNVIATTTTDANGFYRFTSLAPGSYTVNIVNPPGFTINTTPASQPVTLAAGQSIDTVDFGLRQAPATIGNLVFQDTNGNGVQDAGEPGISGITVILRDPNGNVIATTTTDANGNYQFVNVPPGINYTVTLVPPTGFAPTTPSLVTVNPPIGGAGVANFGLQPAPGAIGDTVFNDANGNGVQDPGEVGFGGVVVTLRDAAGTVIATAVTDANGNYRFNNLPAGTYTVTLTPPLGSTLTTPGQLSFNLASGQIVENADFGLQGVSGAGLRLVKRITNATRNNIPVTGLNFGQFVDDPADVNDNAPGWIQNNFPPVGAINIAPPVQVRSGDELTYTVYFLSDGPGLARNVRVCDLVPPGTTFVAGSTQIQRLNNAPVAGGAVFSPLAPLPPGNPCADQNNPNGAVIFDLGDIPNTTGANFGFVRFRVRVN